MTVDLTEREDSRDRAVGVVIALTASSMLGVTLAFARVALGAHGVVPHVGWGFAVTVGWAVATLPRSKLRGSTPESVALPASETGNATPVRPVHRRSRAPERSEAASNVEPASLLAGGAALAELALIIAAAHQMPPILVALFAWHALHTTLAVITRDATVRRLLTRFTALSWFGVALAVWGLA